MAAPPSPRKRLKPDERRALILQAAREAFSKTGDANGTTIKAIAARAKISEGVIYRHFASKEELFAAAIVEPLHEAISGTVENLGDFDLAGLSDRELHDLIRQFWASMIRSTEKILPLIGLVLFGETDEARKFYRRSIKVAIDELAQTMERMYEERGLTYPTREMAISAVGILLAFALDARYNPDHERARALEGLTTVTQYGFWPLHEAPAAAPNTTTKRRSTSTR
ncbi:MAG TPA: helix-turn-helix domain-containing protein [Acidimicrobiia bacterium]|nr:helix-turn-helix domain-containing protein [Acidimicrobiia bacterium]